MNNVEYKGYSGIIGWATATFRQYFYLGHYVTSVYVHHKDIKAVIGKDRGECYLTTALRIGAWFASVRYLTIFLQISPLISLSALVCLVSFATSRYSQQSFPQTEDAAVDNSVYKHDNEEHQKAADCFIKIFKNCGITHTKYKWIDFHQPFGCSGNDFTYKKYFAQAPSPSLLCVLPRGDQQESYWSNPSSISLSNVHQAFGEKDYIICVLSPADCYDIYRLSLVSSALRQFLAHH